MHPIGRRLRVRLVAATWLLGTVTVPALAQQLGPEFQLNSFTTGWQISPALAAHGSGGFLVAWNSAEQDGSSWGVFGQLFDWAGLPVGSEFRVNSHTTASQRDPGVAALASGEFVVVWQSYGQDGSYSGVFGRRFDSAGAPVGSEFRVNSFTLEYQRYPAVAADGVGNFVVVWESGRVQDGSLYGIFGQRFDGSAHPLGSEFRVNSYTTGSQTRPRVATNGAGGFVVVWESLEQDGSAKGVFGRRFDAAGLPLGSDFQVNSFTTSGQKYPVVALDDDGGFVVAWASYAQDGSADGIFGQRFDAAGLTLGSEFRVNTETEMDQRVPALALDGAGGFLVLWSGFSLDPSFDEVFGQRFDPAGLRVGSEFQANDYATSNQQHSEIAMEASGDFVVVWQSYGQDGSGHGIIGRRMPPPLFRDGFETDDVCAWSLAVGGGYCP